MSLRLHDSLRRAVAAPARDIIEKYGWHAAMERWPDLTNRQLQGLRNAAKNASRRNKHVHGGQPAARIGGIDPPGVDFQPEGFLTSGEAYRECGLCRRGQAFL